jgi:hypothetical protein
MHFPLSRVIRQVGLSVPCPRLHACTKTYLYYTYCVLPCTLGEWLIAALLSMAQQHTHEPARTNASYQEVTAAARLRCNTGIAPPLSSNVTGILHPAKAEASLFAK